MALPVEVDRDMSQFRRVYRPTAIPVEEDGDDYDDLRCVEDHLPGMAWANNGQRRQLWFNDDRRILDSSIIPREDVHSLDLNKSGFSAALTCYPIAFSLASHLDLNDLHALSRTCRRFYATLLPFHRQLVKQSLRCTNDAKFLMSELMSSNLEIPFDLDEDFTNRPTNVLRAILVAHRYPFTDDLAGTQWRLLRNSKLGRCARDLVAECRKCGRVVCRNCTAKPSVNPYLTGRLRRLCGACLEAPLQAHLAQVKFKKPVFIGDGGIISSSASSTRSMRSTSPSSSPPSNDGVSSAAEPPTLAFTSEAFARSPCTCGTDGIYLCDDCGQGLRTADTVYKRVWTWRSRYSSHIGGLGTGMGEGDQGQKCGRGEDCLDPMGGGLCWVEIDSCEQNRHDSILSRSPPRQAVGGGPSGSAGGEQSSSGDLDLDQRGNEKPGYLSQEIEGIGGVVKKKVKKKVRPGATVWEFDDERESGKYLEREASGVQRSWCGWCNRVVMGEQDQAGGQPQ